MPKTKVTPKTKIKKTAIKVVKEPVKNEVTKQVYCSRDNFCYLCTVYKVMILLFLLMVIFWIGFSFGHASMSQSFINKYRPMSFNRYENFDKKTKMCPDAPSDQLASKINSSLNNKTGEQFDKEFLLNITLNNQASLDMAKLALDKALNKDVKKLAQEIVDAQTKLIDKIKTWQEDFKTKGE